MFELMVFVFILGYTAIALEHPLKVNKAASALFIGAVLWVIYIFGASQILTGPGKEGFTEFLAHHPEEVAQPVFHQYVAYITDWEIIHHLGEISEILFFLLGAMTIVELVDQHHGFRIITDKITTRNKVKLLWILSVITFFLSAVLDNLTTTIVMIALLRKLVVNQRDRWIFASMVVIAANAGGAWSPIGDVTTIMLWIGGQVTTMSIIMRVFIPSVVSMLVPLAIMSFFERGHLPVPETRHSQAQPEPSKRKRNVMFFAGVGVLVFVPVFKTITHLPPYIGMLFGLSVLWVFTEIMYRKHDDATEPPKPNVVRILTRIDTPTILFFLGILSAVAALQSAGHLKLLAEYLDKQFHNIFIIDGVIGILSSIVDNVPLVAGAMGMYPVHGQEFINAITDPAAQQYAMFFVQDGLFWEFLAYCAGTGGSILIIGSAAGVAAMGMEKIDFIWYLKRISLYALVGYLAGAFCYYLMFS